MTELTSEEGVIPGIEVVLQKGRALAYIIPASVETTETSFITDSDEPLQLGFVFYREGGQVQPHSHVPVIREVGGTTEVLTVRRGRCALDLYDDDHRLLATRTLNLGDVVLLVSGGHGVRMEEDTLLFEVKQGPYMGVEEKIRFEPKMS